MTESEKELARQAYRAMREELELYEKDGYTPDDLAFVMGSGLHSLFVDLNYLPVSDTRFTDVRIFGVRVFIDAYRREVRRFDFTLKPKRFAMNDPLLCVRGADGQMVIEGRRKETEMKGLSGEVSGLFEGTVGARVAAGEIPEGAEWEQTEYGRKRCSACKKVYIEDEWTGGEWKYCPVCGAAMTAKA